LRLADVSQISQDRLIELFMLWNSVINFVNSTHALGIVLRFILCILAIARPYWWQSSGPDQRSIVSNAPALLWRWKYISYGTSSSLISREHRFFSKMQPSILHNPISSAKMLAGRCIMRVHSNDPCKLHILFFLVGRSSWPIHGRH
jgi:hypothetical protein